MQEQELQARLAAGKESLAQYLQAHVLDRASHRCENINDKYDQRKVPLQMLKDLNSG